MEEEMDWEVYVSWVKYVGGELGRHDRERGGGKGEARVGRGVGEGEVRYSGNKEWRSKMERRG